jgi:hypothetical protein
MAAGHLGKAVKLDKLARQIRRDIAASPKKAAALGLMLVVALYFWAPMVWGWIGKGGKSKPATAVGLILEDEPVDPAAKASKARLVFAWEKIRKQIAADPRMTPAVFQPSWNDPFTNLEQRAETQASGAASTQTTGPSELDPDKAGLRLTSVVIGTRQRWATIGRESYLEGELVRPLAADGKPMPGIEFLLVRVDRHEVELARNGKTYILSLDRPVLAPGDEIDRERRN